ncbi:MAG: DUF4926 domain-containing protein [candidate division Zixibacteria bacterium]|nr:DUF4926 domain-containing protein [candidate division KSB1 bacterium]NIR64298.1 DUF4926 domain-containing protein [candidate division Zixibacteria bacterium]NIW45165.1 DUF4926 domain-containing protein [Gammaproteobacteria bacterium]NIS46201.1 DUF4926 domain-containing protein [candidate division Zixibacteria bacterium]NIT71451.1 DUF4926 domain-containing protein [candidate division KSB1 bacterium]
MIKELDLVVLTHDIEVHGLKSGDVGTLLHCYADKTPEHCKHYNP